MQRSFLSVDIFNHAVCSALLSEEQKSEYFITWLFDHNIMTLENSVLQINFPKIAEHMILILDKK